MPDASPLEDNKLEMTVPEAPSVTLFQCLPLPSGDAVFVELDPKSTRIEAVCARKLHATSRDSHKLNLRKVFTGSGGGGGWKMGTQVAGIGRLNQSSVVSSWNFMRAWPRSLQTSLSRKARRRNSAPIEQTHTVATMLRGSTKAGKRPPTTRSTPLTTPPTMKPWRQ